MDHQRGTQAGLRELALFAGGGGGILGGLLLGWRTVCAVELDPYAASVLVVRQNDGILPPFPIWDNVCTFAGRPWRGLVDVVSGGFPCQDISAAGRGAGIDGERSGLWREMARIIGEVRPKYVFVENSPLLVGRGLTRILGDLAEMGFDTIWGIVGAHHVGAPHLRERIWILAHTRCARRWEDPRSPHEDEGPHEGRPTPEADQPDGYGQGSGARHVAHSNRHEHESGPHARSGQGEAEETPELFCNASSQGLLSATHAGIYCSETSAGARNEQPQRSDWWSVEPDVGRVADELAFGMDIIGADEA